MAPEAFPATRGRKEVGREWERGSGLNKPGGLQWGHPNYWGKLLPLTLQTFWNFAPTEVEVGGGEGYMVKRKEGVSPSARGGQLILPSCVEQLLCTEVSNAHTLAELGDRTLALVVVQVPGLTQTGLRL